MQYDIISVRSTRTPYKVTRPADVYAALKCYATSKVEEFFAISLDGQHAILHINMVSEASSGSDPGCRFRKSPRKIRVNLRAVLRE
jgi:hypothetical protein